MHPHILLLTFLPLTLAQDTTDTNDTAVPDALTHLSEPCLDPVTTTVEEFAIRQTLNAYPLAIDTKNFTALSLVFTPDVNADYSTDLGILNGLEAVEEALQQTLTYVTTQHTLSTQVINLLSPTEASAVTYANANHFGMGSKAGMLLIAYLRYEDGLVKGDDGWKISTRRLVYMGPFFGNTSIFTP